MPAGFCARLAAPMSTVSPTPTPIIPGYQVGRLIGHGGMADVYLGTQLSLSRPVAIKVLAAHDVHDDANATRFEQEARTIARLDHPDIVSIYDVGRTGDGRLYYTMPYLARGDLGARDLRGNPAAIAAIVRAICRALAYAHGLGIVHRDVKPGNILFDNLDRPLLADFGIALSADHSRVTREGSTIGSSGYSSPEQARGKALDGRADLYSLGVVTYELLCGELPFRGPDTLSMALAHVEQPVPRLPQELRRWQPFLDKAMAKDPAHRFQSAIEMQAAVDAIDAEIARADAPRAARSRWPRLAAALLAIVIGGAIAVGVVKQRQAAPDKSTTGVVESPPAVEAPAAPVPEPAAAEAPAAQQPEPSAIASSAAPAQAGAAPSEPAPAEVPAGASLRDPDGPELAFVPGEHGGFWLAKYEVTRAEYAAFVQATGPAASVCREPLQPLSRWRKLSWRAPGFSQGERHPVVCVSWKDAIAYAHWLSERTHADYRLPTRAQWLTAARALPKGVGNCAQGNLGGHSRLPFHLGGSNGCRGSAEQTVEVGRFRANQLGIYDLVGNVSEWVQDCKRGAIDASGHCTEHLFTGASWRDGADVNNLDVLGDADVDVGYTTVGFRVLRKLDANEATAH